MLDELQGASWFSNIDLHAGYHHIRVVHDDISKTAFKMHSGHYEFPVRLLVWWKCTDNLSINYEWSLLVLSLLLCPCFFFDVLVYSAAKCERLPGSPFSCRCYSFWGLTSSWGIKRNAPLENTCLSIYVMWSHKWCSNELQCGGGWHLGLWRSCEAFCS